MQLVFFPSFPARFVHLWSLSFNDIFLYVWVPIDSYPSPKRRGKKNLVRMHTARIYIYIPRSMFIYIFSLRVAGDVLVCAVKRLWEMGAYLQNFELAAGFLHIWTYCVLIIWGIFDELYRKINWGILHGQLGFGFTLILPTSVFSFWTLTSKYSHISENWNMYVLCGFVD